MKKIMIVDDSHAIANVMKRCLTNSGYDVQIITDSGLFFDGCVQTFSPDLFIIDINMPAFDGFYLLECIKKQNICPEAKIIMCSTKFFEHDMLRARDLGADDFLVKPFNDKELIAKIASVIG